MSGSVQAQVIVSGVGDWRYVDCVSKQGGKLQALEYVRALFNIPRSHCLSAGDSGNDILMLQGNLQNTLMAVNSLMLCSICCQTQIAQKSCTSPRVGIDTHAFDMFGVFKYLSTFLGEVHCCHPSEQMSSSLSTGVQVKA